MFTRLSFLLLLLLVFVGLFWWSEYEQDIQSFVADQRPTVFSGIQGTVYVPGDASSADLVPAPRGILVAFPPDTFVAIEHFLGQADAGTPLSKFTATLSREDVLAVPHVQGLIEDRGKYRMDLSPGRYVVCIANSDAQTEQEVLEFPRVITGCAEVKVTLGFRHTRDLEYGEPTMVRGAEGNAE